MTYDSTNPEHRASLAEAIAKYEHFLATVPRTQLLHGPAVQFGMPDGTPAPAAEGGTAT
jgi:hypothetical protein